MAKARRLEASRCLCVALAAGILFVLGCQKDDGRLKAYPVHGKVTVDGKPTKGIYVFFSPKTPPETHGIFPNAITDENGEYWVSTYDANDGAPPGDYAVTAAWPMGEGLQVRSDGPDHLRGRYSDPAKPIREITVKEATKAAPNEVPLLELTKK